MKGGIRTGAGRKPSEKTVQIRIPTGAIEAVKQLVDEYKTKQSLNIAPTINEKRVKPALTTQKTPPPQDILIIAPKINKPDEFALKYAPEINEALRMLESLGRKEKRTAIKIHGTLRKAAEHAVKEAITSSC